MLKLRDVLAIIRNDDGLYKGDLRHYFRAFFLNAQSSQNPYHNLRHPLFVMQMCYDACQYYQRRFFGPDDMRALLIAALFHDFDHSGMKGEDDLNIARALRGLKKHLLPEDQHLWPAIEGAMRATEFPYVIPSENLFFPEKIIRDADSAQAFSDGDWLQQTIIGLAGEWNMKPIDVLRMQNGFLSGLELATDWGMNVIGSLIQPKIYEAQEFLTIIQGAPAA